MNNLDDSSAVTFLANKKAERRNGFSLLLAVFRGFAGWVGGGWVGFSLRVILAEVLDEEPVSQEAEILGRLMELAAWIAVGAILGGCIAWGIGPLYCYCRVRLFSKPQPRDAGNPYPPAAV